MSVERQLNKFRRKRIFGFRRKESEGKYTPSVYVINEPFSLNRYDQRRDYIATLSSHELRRTEGERKGTYPSSS